MHERMNQVFMTHVHVISRISNFSKEMLKVIQDTKFFFNFWLIE